MEISLKERVAIVTGAGRGLGRAHALALAAAGAKVLVNDLDCDAGDATARAIIDRGGDAIADAGSVIDESAMRAAVESAMTRWGRVDALVNNAGVLRDKTFAKMSLDDFRHVLDIHVIGAATCTKAVWDIMRTQNYGRIVMTTSSSGLFGNFGQSNYTAAKMAVVGLMQTLALEGERYGVHVNALAPSAATRMTEGVVDEDLLQDLPPERVSPAVVFLASDAAPNRAIICAGGGAFERAYVTLTRGVFLGPAPAAAALAAAFDQISDRREDMAPSRGFEQMEYEARQASVARAALEG